MNAAWCCNSHPLLFLTNLQKPSLAIFIFGAHSHIENVWYNLLISYLGALELGIVLHIAFKIILWLSETKQSEICNQNQVSRVMGQHCKWLRHYFNLIWFQFCYLHSLWTEPSSVWSHMEVSIDSHIYKSANTSHTHVIIEETKNWWDKNWDFLALCLSFSP